MTTEEFLAAQREAWSEEAFQAAVEELARGNGWLVYHTRNSQGSETGFPDLVSVRGDEVCIAELKTMRGRLSVSQQRWTLALGRALPGRVFVWRPNNWPEIVAVFEAKGAR